MPRLLSVYNICNIGNQGNVPYYIDSLRSLLSQDFDGEHKVAVSGCMVLDGTQRGLEGIFGQNLTYNFIEEPHPLSITFNDTVNQCVKHFGAFDGYLYVDSGISFWDPSKRYDALQLMWNVHASGPYAITAAFPSNDDGSSWWGIQYEPEKDFVFPVGKTTNMHCQIFSEEWRQAYGRVLPDIFADHTMESTFSFLTAAIKRKFIITQKVHLLHNHSMDGASVGSRNKAQHPDFFPSSEMSPSVLLYKTKKSMDERHRGGYELGFGYEECKPYWNHDPDKYDAEGFAKDERLAPYLKQEFFLKPEEFDYGTVKRMFIPGK